MLQWFLRFSELAEYYWIHSFILETLRNSTDGKMLTCWSMRNQLAWNKFTLMLMLISWIWTSITVEPEAPIWLCGQTLIWSARQQRAYQVRMEKTREDHKSNQAHCLLSRILLQLSNMLVDKPASVFQPIHASNLLLSFKVIMSLPQSILPKILKPRYHNMYGVVQVSCFMTSLPQFNCCAQFQCYIDCY